MENTIERAKEVLNNSKENIVYYRETEKKHIFDFIASDKPILHITGSPGTGKTCTVIDVTRGFEIKYLNYFHDVKIGVALKKILLSHKSEQKIIVIDEFDNYFNSKNKECMKYLNLIEKLGIKVITISNDTKFSNVKFRQYSREEMVSIIKKKLKSAIDEVVITDNALEFICKKFEKLGDLRLVQKYFLSILSKNKCQLPIKLEDLIVRENETEEKNIQHLLIKSMLKEETVSYQDYLARCEEKHIPKLSKADFKMILEYYILE